MEFNILRHHANRPWKLTFEDPSLAKFQVGIADNDVLQMVALCHHGNVRLLMKHFGLLPNGIYDTSKFYDQRKIIEMLTIVQDKSASQRHLRHDHFPESLLIRKHKQMQLFVREVIGSVNYRKWQEEAISRAVQLGCSLLLLHFLDFKASDVDNAELEGFKKFFHRQLMGAIDVEKRAISQHRTKREQSERFCTTEVLKVWWEKTTGMKLNEEIEELAELRNKSEFKGALICQCMPQTHITQHGNHEWVREWFDIAVSERGLTSSNSTGSTDHEWLHEWSRKLNEEASIPYQIPEIVNSTFAEECRKDWTRFAP